MWWLQRPFADGYAAGERFVVAIAGPDRAPSGIAGLATVEQTLESAVEIFEEMGYEHKLRKLASRTTAEDLSCNLTDFFNGRSWTEEDVVAIYYCGAAAVDGAGSDILFRADAEHEVPGFQSFGLSALVNGLEDGGVRRALVVLDCRLSSEDDGEFPCAAFEVAERMREGICVILGTGPWDVTTAKSLAAVFGQAAGEPIGSFDAVCLEYFPLDSVIARMNQLLLPERNVQGFGACTEIDPCFIGSEFHDPSMPDELDLATQHRWEREIDEGYIDERWEIVGRRRAREELVTWLDSPPDGQAHVLTGVPGSGKSALVSWLLDPAPPAASPFAAVLGSAADAMPPTNRVRVFVDAADMTLLEVVTRIAMIAGAKAETPQDLLRCLNATTPPVNIVVDRLDEAAEPEGICAGLLRPLMDRMCARLLVITAPSGKRLLGTGSVIHDLDDPHYDGKSDVRDFILHNLLAPGAPEGYSENRRLAEWVAAEAAECAGANFLVGRMVSLAFRHRGSAVSAGVPDWRNELPATIGEALDREIARFGAREQEARELLLPLACARGSGLPWEGFWAPLAVELSGRATNHYGDANVRWLIDRIGAHIVGTNDGSRMAYRLYRPALAKHLLRSYDPGELNGRMMDALTMMTPYRNGDGERDWRTAHPYVLTHLAGHAMMAGRLAELVRDPLFLTCAHPYRLLAALAGAPVVGDLEEVVTYRAAFPGLIHSSGHREAAACLAATARELGFERFVERVGALTLPRY